MTNPNDNPQGKTPAAPGSMPPAPKPFPSGKPTGPNSFNPNNQAFKALMNNKANQMNRGIASHGQGRGGGGNKGRGGK